MANQLYLAITPKQLQLQSLWRMDSSHSPLLLLAMVWAVIASCRRVNQQFKVLFLFWFGLPVFGFYFLLSFNKAAAPNWDALAMFGFGLLAICFWRQRLNKHALIRICAGLALALGVLMSALALETDLLRSAGLHLWRKDPSDRMRGWKSATIALEKMRNDLESRKSAPITSWVSKKSLRCQGRATP